MSFLYFIEAELTYHIDFECTTWYFNIYIKQEIISVISLVTICHCKKLLLLYCRLNYLYCTLHSCDLFILWLEVCTSCCCCCCVASVVSDSVWPHRWQPTRLPVPGILQARTLEWVAMSFSNAWKWKVKVKSLSRVRL